MTDEDRAAAIRRKALMRIEAAGASGTRVGFIEIPMAHEPHVRKAEINTAVAALLADGSAELEAGVLRTPAWAEFNRRFEAEYRRRHGSRHRRGLAVIGRAVDGRFNP